MDKIMSTRIDEAVIRHIGMLAKKLGTSKKAVLENAVRYYAEKIESEQGLENVEKIMAVEGVDGCWIGPADLAAHLQLLFRDQAADRILKALLTKLFFRGII